MPNPSVAQTLLQFGNTFGSDLRSPEDQESKTLQVLQVHQARIGNLRAFQVQCVQFGQAFEFTQFLVVELGVPQSKSFRLAVPGARTTAE